MSRSEAYRMIRSRAFDVGVSAQITIDFQSNSGYGFHSVQRDRLQLSKLTKFRSRCPLASMLDLIGDKWSLLVLRDLYLGKTLFSEFEESWEGISPAVLSDRLKAMENMGLVKRSLYSERPLRAEYRLTPLGDSLVKSILPLAEWGHSHIAGRYPIPQRDIFKTTSREKS